MTSILGYSAYVKTFSYIFLKNFKVLTYLKDKITNLRYIKMDVIYLKLFLSVM